MLSPPDNLPEFKQESGFIMGGFVAEQYKGGKLTNILAEYSKHRAVGTKTLSEDEYTPVDQFKPAHLKGKTIVEKDGKQMVHTIKETIVRGYKIYNE